MTLEGACACDFFLEKKDILLVLLPRRDGMVGVCVQQSAVGYEGGMCVRLLLDEGKEMEEEAKSRMKLVVAGPA